MFCKVERKFRDNEILAKFRISMKFMFIGAVNILRFTVSYSVVCPVDCIF
jgi:hypothetical protein